MNTSDKYKKLEAIIVRNQDYLFRFAYFRIGDREEAEDILQEVFLKLFDNDFEIENDESMRMYLFRTVYHACNDYHRHKKRNVVPLCHEQLEIVDESDREMQQEYQRIWQYLDALPPEQAEVIQMHLSDNLTFVEIAKVTGKAETTIKSRYKSGIEKLRNVLKKEGIL